MTNEEIIEESKKYSSIGEIKENNRYLYFLYKTYLTKEESEKIKDFHRHKKNNLRRQQSIEKISNFSDTTREGTNHNRCIYAFIFENQKSVYVGLSKNVKMRKRQHLGKDSPVRRFIDNNKIQSNEIEFKILTPLLDPIEAQEKEGEWLRHYIEQGYTPVNTAPTGNLGGTSRRYTREIIEENAKQYTKYSDWTLNAYQFHRVAREIAIEEKDEAWFQKITAHLDRSKIKYSKEEIETAAKEYQYIQDWKISPYYNSATSHSKKLGNEWFESLMNNMTKKPKKPKSKRDFTYEEIVEASKEFDSMVKWCKFTKLYYESPTATKLRQTNDEKWLSIVEEMRLRREAKLPPPKPKNVCPICGKKIDNYSNTCITCFNKRNRRLPPDENLVDLHYIQKKTYVEIGEMFGVRGQSVYRMLKRLKQKEGL
jgi:hypothetical protein